VAASFVLVSLIVGAGWISRAARQTDGLHAAVDKAAVRPHHVILDIGTSNEASFGVQPRRVRGHDLHLLQPLPKGRPLTGS